MSYNLEQVCSTHSRVYRQLYNYYNFCEHACRMSPATLKSKIYVLNDFIRTTKLRDLHQISNQQIFDWIEAQSLRGNSGRSINNRLAHLKVMLRWQREMNLAMPKLKLGLIRKTAEVPPRKVCFSRTDIQAALKFADSETWLMIRLAFDCGLRISELQNLTINDFQGDQANITGKGQKQRFVYLCQEVRSRLNRWILEQNISNYLWPSPIHEDRPLAICTIRERMRIAFKLAGFDDFCPHDLRHSYATDLKRLGAPTRQIQAGLGHSSEAITEHYLSDLEGFDLRELYKLKYSH